jgi:hypothetical protein
MESAYGIDLGYLHLESFDSKTFARSARWKVSATKRLPLRQHNDHVKFGNHFRISFELFSLSSSSASIVANGPAEKVEHVAFVPLTMPIMFGQSSRLFAPRRSRRRSRTQSLRRDASRFPTFQSGGSGGWTVHSGFHVLTCEPLDQPSTSSMISHNVWTSRSSLCGNRLTAAHIRS